MKDDQKVATLGTRGQRESQSIVSEEQLIEQTRKVLEGDPSFRSNESKGSDEHSNPLQAKTASTA